MCFVTFLDVFQWQNRLSFPLWVLEDQTNDDTSTCDAPIDLKLFSKLDDITGQVLVKFQLYPAMQSLGMITCSLPQTENVV